MSSIVEKLNEINDIKNNIKQAIRDKGVDVVDGTPFAEYPNCIRNIEAGGAYKDFYNAKTNNGTNFYSLFAGYSGERLDLSNFDTSAVTDMSSMFYSCESLITLDVSSFDTSKVTNMNGMLSYCVNLEELDLRNFDTSKVTDMNGMFRSCSSLTSLDLSSFDTSNVTWMNDMFFYCSNLEELDLRNFYMNAVDEYAGIGSMFGYCDSLHTLRLDNCNDVTISLIIYSSNFPTNAINGVARNIYCKQSESYDRGLLPPKNWFFQCTDTGNIINSGGGMI